MGVKDLNSLIRNYPCNIRHFNTIIFDGTNVIITYLNNQISILQNLFNLKRWDSINKNIIYQMKYIIDNTTNCIVNELLSHKERFDCENIYFVMDPKSKVVYTLNDSMKINENIDIFNGESILKIDLKSEEQDKRNSATSKDANISIQTKNIEEIFTKLNNFNDNIISEVYKQSFHWKQPCNLYMLIKIIIYKLSNEMLKYDNICFDIIQSKDEADLVIKNIGVDICESEENVLICSADTDYYVLFSDMPNAYMSGIHANDTIYNPHEEWKNLFSKVLPNEYLTELNIYKYSIRFSALFGNDYTGTTTISIHGKNCYDFLNIINLQKNINEFNKNSHIYKYLLCNQKDIALNKIQSPEDIDLQVCKYLKSCDNKNVKIFSKYIFSVTVYSYYKEFGNYDILSKNYINVTKNIKWLIENLFYGIPNKNKKYNILYNWETLELIDYDNIYEMGTIDDIDELIEYYDSLEIPINFQKINYSEYNNIDFEI